jgi:hypothetical protein
VAQIMRNQARYQSHPAAPTTAQPRTASSPPLDRRPSHSLTGGGTDGNERLTTWTGVVLIVLLAALGLTIVRIGQLLWWHLLLGFVLLGPLALKLASTGYRFVRYYTSDPEYRRKGPPQAALRMLAPLLVAVTLAVFGTGIVLLAVGPTGRDPWLLLHKATFILWLGVTALHVLGHLPELLGALAGARRTRKELISAGLPSRSSSRPDAIAGATGRGLALACSIVLGVVLAIVLSSDFGSWTHAFSAFGGLGDH